MLVFLPFARCAPAVASPPRVPPAEAGGEGLRPPTQGRALGRPERCSRPGRTPTLRSGAGIRRAATPVSAPPGRPLGPLGRGYARRQRVPGGRGCGLDALAPASPAPTCAPISRLISSTRNCQSGLFDRTGNFAPRSRGCCAFSESKNTALSCSISRNLNK